VSVTANRPLAGQRILLCVGGGIAAYKALELVRRLRDAGADVQVAMTAGAQQFVTPLSFQALSGYPARTTLWDSAAEQAMGHLELARWADRVSSPRPPPTCSRAWPMAWPTTWSPPCAWPPKRRWRWPRR
jgi:Phosphopantothenoylcysteine synthetase/decarboxylase